MVTYNETLPDPAPSTVYDETPVEGMPEYILGVGACAKTDAGKRVVEIMNEAFRSFRDTPEYHQIKEYWLDDNSKQLYRKYVAEYYRSERSSSSPAAASPPDGPGRP